MVPSVKVVKRPTLCIKKMDSPDTAPWGFRENLLPNGHGFYVGGWVGLGSGKNPVTM